MWETDWPASRGNIVYFAELGSLCTESYVVFGYTG